MNIFIPLFTVLNQLSKYPSTYVRYGSNAKFSHKLYLSERNNELDLKAHFNEMLAK